MKKPVRDGMITKFPYDCRISNHCTCPDGTPYIKKGVLIRNCEKCGGFRIVLGRARWRGGGTVD